MSAPIPAGEWKMDVPDRGDALTVGRAILEAHGQWEKENVYRGSQDMWGEQHVVLLGQAAMIAVDRKTAAPKAPDAVTREEVARIFDPEAFDHPAVHPQHLKTRRILALRKADAILALFANTGGRG